MNTMSERTNHTHHRQLRALFKAVETKNLDNVLDFFTEQAEFVDPHYPQMRMCGTAEIRTGLEWGFRSLKKFGFNIIEFYESHNGHEIIVEVETAHILPNGRPLCFLQLFIARFEGDKIQSLEAFVQYRPHGLLGLMLWLHRLRNKLHYQCIQCS